MNTVCIHGNGDIHIVIDDKWYFIFLTEFLQFFGFFKEAGDVRAKLGPDKIIGVSTQTVEQAILAEKHGADYLGVGAVFPTTSKDDAAEVSYDTLKAICEAVSIPVVAIGGITQENVVKLTGSGIDGVAVISAIYAQKDIKKAAADLKAAVKAIV